MRAFAEGLCRLGGYDMVWRDPEGDEVRIAGELDVPLVDRLAAGQDADDGHVRTAPAKVRLAPGGGVEIPGTPAPPFRAIGLFILIVGPGALSGLGKFPLPRDSVDENVVICTVIAALGGRARGGQ